MYHSYGACSGLSLWPSSPAPQALCPMCNVVPNAPFRLACVPGPGSGFPAQAHYPADQHWMMYMVPHQALGGGFQFLPVCGAGARFDYDSPPPPLPAPGPPPQDEGGWDLDELDEAEAGTGKGGAAAVSAPGEGERSGNVGGRPRTFPCPSCPLVFPQAYQLNRHMRSHTGERPFVCGVCHSAFARKDTLVQHGRSHTGEQPYGCPYCPSRYTRLTGMKKHMLKHGVVKKPGKRMATAMKAASTRAVSPPPPPPPKDPAEYACSQCGVAFPRAFLLQRHLASAHTADARCARCALCSASQCAFPVATAGL